jgi:hypothetical protein
VIWARELNEREETQLAVEEEEKEEKEEEEEEEEGAK